MQLQILLVIEEGGELQPHRVDLHQLQEGSRSHSPLSADVGCDRLPAERDGDEEDPGTRSLERGNAEDLVTIIALELVLCVRYLEVLRGFEAVRELDGGRRIEESERDVEGLLEVVLEELDLLLGLGGGGLVRARMEDVEEGGGSGVGVVEGFHQDSRRDDRFQLDEVGLLDASGIWRGCWRSRYGETRSATRKEVEARSDESEKVNVPGVAVKPAGN